MFYTHTTCRRSSISSINQTDIYSSTWRRSWFFKSTETPQFSRAGSKCVYIIVKYSDICCLFTTRTTVSLNISTKERPPAEQHRCAHTSDNRHTFRGSMLYILCFQRDPSLKSGHTEDTLLLSTVNRLRNCSDRWSSSLHDLKWQQSPKITFKTTWKTFVAKIAGGIVFKVLWSTSAYHGDTSRCISN